jgi:hypothetical protein
MTKSSMTTSGGKTIKLGHKHLQAMKRMQNKKRKVSHVRATVPSTVGKIIGGGNPTARYWAARMNDAGYHPPAAGPHVVADDPVEHIDQQLLWWRPGKAA